TGRRLRLLVARSLVAGRSGREVGDPLAAIRGRTRAKARGGACGAGARAGASGARPGRGCEYGRPGSVAHPLRSHDDRGAEPGGVPTLDYAATSAAIAQRGTPECHAAFSGAPRPGAASTCRLAGVVKHRSAGRRRCFDAGPRPRPAAGTLVPTRAATGAGDAKLSALWRAADQPSRSIHPALVAGTT